MDSGLLDTLIGAIVGGVLALIGSIGATWIALNRERRREREDKYQERLEEIQYLAIQVKKWEFAEFEGWFLLMDLGGKKITNKWDCPIDRLEMLIARYEPTLTPTVVKIKKLVNDIQNTEIEAFRQGIRDDAEVFDEYAKPYHENFEKLYREMPALFEKVNSKNAKMVYLK